MNLISWLADFSRANCIGICAFLVPTILISTTLFLACFYQQRPRWTLHLSYGAILAAAGVMVLHVASWFSIGVVTPVTFILLGLALSCLSLATVVCFFAPPAMVEPWKQKFSLSLKI